MSARNVATAPPQALRKRTRLTTAALCALLLAATAALLTRTVLRRREAAETAYQPGVIAEQPAVLATLGMIWDDGDASVFLAETLLGERGVAPPASRLESARRLAIESIAGRPGSAYFRVLLARTVPLGKGSRVALWQRPLDLAANAAPGLDAAPEALASRYLGIWPALGPEEHARASSVLERAFRSPSFVRGNFAEALFALGPEGAVRLLPGDPLVLSAALEVTEEKGDVRASERLRSRLKAPVPPRGQPEASRPSS
jgi:hypothetical protein